MKLYYFDVMGRGEAIRMALTHAKVDFEDIRLDKEKFTKLKESDPSLFEFNVMPVLEDDGKKLSQSLAILRYVGNKYGYSGADVHQNYLIDSFFDAFGDLFQKFVKVHTAATEEEKKQAGVELATVHLPFFLGKFEARVAANGKEGHFVGDKYTVADFHFGAFVSAIIYNDAQPASAGLRPVFE